MDLFDIEGFNSTFTCVCVCDSMKLLVEVYKETY